MACPTFTISQTPVNQTVFLYPNGDSAVNHTPFGGVENYLCVDESRYVPNDDTDYVYNDTAAELSDLYNAEDHTSEAGTINYVTVFARAKSNYVSQSDTGIFKLLCSENGTIGESDNFAPLGTSYQIYSSVFPTNPDTGLAWSWAEVDNMLVGVKSSSPMVTNPDLQTVLRPNGAGTYAQLYSYPNVSLPNWDSVDDVEPDEQFVTTDANGAEYDTYAVPNHTTETGVIDNITIFGRMMRNSSTPAYGKLIVRINGTNRYSGQIDLTQVWNTYSYAWTVNPNSTVTWTWANVDDIQIGVLLYTDDTTKHNTYCTQLYAVVNYHKNFYPEIRTTSCYASVNYTPATQSLTLKIPSSADYRHGSRIGKSIFRDKTYTSRDYGRRNKTVSLDGTQTTDVRTAMNTLRTICKLGYPITISGMDDRLDGEYMIKDYSLRYENGISAVALRWMLEIERTT